MPLPPRVQEPPLNQTEDAKTLRKTSFGLAFFAIFVVVFLRGFDTTLAQSDVTDTDLLAASNGRPLRIRSVADGHVTIFPPVVYAPPVLAAEGGPQPGDAAQ